MRCSKYLTIFLIAFLPGKSFAQPASPAGRDITGLWKGTLYNDSTKKFYKYEIGISEEKGKLSGFSHTWFILDDKEYYGVKKVKIKIAPDGKIIIEDAMLIANNYPESPAKGVHQLNVLTLEIKDSIMTLSGPFTTNRTRSFSSLTGTVNLQRKNDFWQSALVPHLQELGLVDNLSFVKKENDKTAEDKKLPQKDIATNENSRELKKENPVKTTEIKKEPGREVKSNETKSVKASSKEPVTNAQPKKPPTSVVKSNEPAAEVASRANIVQQTVYFTADSLQLSLYDNGEVDGDTVSVLMNGKIIMPNVGLSTNAVRKTIYTGGNTDSIELVMYAENLGSIPPNTGLLVVHDGKNIYEIRFSGDLQKNAAIILRRRKN